MTLQRWEPLREMESLRDAIDRLFRDSFVHSRGTLAPTGPGSFALDLVENPDTFVVRAALPGIKPEDIEITAQGNTLTLRGQSQVEEERAGQTWLLRERQSGFFQRSLTLPTPITADQAEAQYEHGMLTLTLPKAEVARPKQIKVGSQAQLGAGQPGSGS
jgi:HSP20 family protein